MLFPFEVMDRSIISMLFSTRVAGRFGSIIGVELFDKNFVTDGGLDIATKTPTPVRKKGKRMYCEV